MKNMKNMMKQAQQLQNKSQKMVSEEMSKLTGGMNIPGLM